MQERKAARPEASELSQRSQQCNERSIAPASDETHYLIVGVTHRHRPFRPSDWAERLADVVALFIDERGPQAARGRRHFASPVVHEGVKSLLIDAGLRHACPDAFAFVSSFAAENDLPMHGYPCIGRSAR
jgi:hypothetical protein